MNFKLIDGGWQRVMDEALRSRHPKLRIVCPFIKRGAAERMLELGRPGEIQVITRFNLCDFYNGVSDTSALRLLLEHGAEIRGVRNLHAKVYLFGAGRAIVTSANLTNAGLTRNLEFGFQSDDAGIIAECGAYFEALWQRAGPNLLARRLEAWDAKVVKAQSAGSRPAPPFPLGDEGTDAGLPEPPIVTEPIAAEATQWFVKFFGETRAVRSMSIIDELKRSDSHWACTYPKGKRPRGVEDGAILFMGRMVGGPNDILIYGRAIGMHYRDDVDDASAQEIARRSWKADWPHYIRVHHGEFIAGTLADGVSLNSLMSSLRSDAFESTRRNTARGTGNTNPRRAYGQQPAVKLTPHGAAWVQERLEAAFALHGKLTPTDMQGLDWPS